MAQLYQAHPSGRDQNQSAESGSYRYLHAHAYKSLRATWFQTVHKMGRPGKKTLSSYVINRLVYLLPLRCDLTMVWDTTFVHQLL